MTPIPPTSVQPTSARPAANQRRAIAAAAQQFEAIFVRQMLAAARKSSFGGDELFGGQGMETFCQLQDERFADIAAQSGAFGIGRMVNAQMAPAGRSGDG